MANHCEKCRDNCCQNIINHHNLQNYPTQEQIDQQNLQFITDYPFFHQSSSYTVEYDDRIIVIPRYSCIYFDTTSQLCQNYDNRPLMCRYAGEKYQVSDTCLLWKKTHPKPKRNFLFW